MRYLKIYSPLFIILTALMGLAYRKFLWCNVLLPVKNEPYGIGDFVGLIPLLVILLLVLSNFIVSVFLFWKKKVTSIKWMLLSLVFSLVSLPVYQWLYSWVYPICDGN